MHYIVGQPLLSDTEHNTWVRALLLPSNCPVQHPCSADADREVPLTKQPLRRSWLVRFDAIWAFTPAMTTLFPTSESENIRSNRFDQWPSEGNFPMECRIYVANRLTIYKIAVIPPLIRLHMKRSLCTSVSPHAEAEFGGRGATCGPR